MTLTELTDEHIRRVMANTARLEDAAEILGIDLATLYRRRRKWQSETIWTTKVPVEIFASCNLRKRSFSASKTFRFSCIFHVDSVIFILPV